MTFSGASLVLSSAGRVPPWHRAEKLLASFEMSSGHNRDTGSIYVEISAAAATGCNGTFTAGQTHLSHRTGLDIAMRLSKNPGDEGHIGASAAGAFACRCQDHCWRAYAFPTLKSYRNCDKISGICWGKKFPHWSQ